MWVAGREVFWSQRCCGVETFGVAFMLIFSVKVDRDALMADYPRGEGEVTFGGVISSLVGRMISYDGLASRKADLRKTILRLWPGLVEVTFCGRVFRQ